MYSGPQWVPCKVGARVPLGSVEHRFTTGGFAKPSSFQLGPSLHCQLSGEIRQVRSESLSPLRPSVCELPWPQSDPGKAWCADTQGGVLACGLAWARGWAAMNSRRFRSPGKKSTKDLMPLGGGNPKLRARPRNDRFGLASRPSHLRWYKKGVKRPASGPRRTAVIRRF